MSGMVPDGSDSRGRRSGDDPAEAEILDLGTGVTPAAVTGTRRDRWMGPAAIGVAVVILAAGIVLASRPDLAIVAASPSGSPTASGDVGIATPITGTSPRPTRFIASPPPCALWDGNSAPDLLVRSGFRAWQPPSYEASGDPSLEADWGALISEVRTRDPSTALGVAAGDEIRVSTFSMTCLAAAWATFVRLDASENPTPIIVGGSIDPAAPAGRFVAPGPGDWLIRITVEIPLASNARWMETYARLLVGADGVPPVPSVLPATACRLHDSREAALFIDGAPVQGNVITVIPFGSVVEVRLAGDHCATTWLIRGVKRVTPDSPDAATFEIAYRSPTPDPAVASQNRFPIAPETPRGTWDVSGTFRFPDGTEIVRTWAVSYRELIVPPLLVGRQGSTSRVKAWVGCGFGVQLPNGGWTGGDGCASNLPEEPLELLIVPAGSRLSFDVDGWEIADWNAEAGTISDGSNGPRMFEGAADGFLRGATSPPVDFPAPGTGTWALMLRGTVVQDGTRVSGGWVMLIEVR